MITVAQRKSRFGAITILKAEDTGSLIYAQGDCYQSAADADGTSTIGYVHALFGLIRQTRSRSVLMIGCGGGTLATMLASIGCKLTVVDIDPHAFLLARRYFRFPPHVTCRVADGCQFLLSETGSFDAVVVDAFNDGRVPAHMTSAAFFAVVRRRIKPAGSVFINAHVEHDLDDAADLLASEMAKQWPEVRILDREGVNHRNAIVMAGDVRELKRPQLEMRPAMDADQITAELDAMAFRPRRTPWLEQASSG
jgi:spermidine synthase